MQVCEKVEKSRFTVTMFLVTWGLGAPDYFARVFSTLYMHLLQSCCVA
jgi:hypothetical protein